MKLTSCRCCCKLFLLLTALQGVALLAIAGTGATAISTTQQRLHAIKAATSKTTIEATTEAPLSEGYQTEVIFKNNRSSSNIFLNALKTTAAVTIKSVEQNTITATSNTRTAAAANIASTAFPGSVHFSNTAASTVAVSATVKSKTTATLTATAPTTQHSNAAQHNSKRQTHKSDQQQNQRNQRIRQARGTPKETEKRATTQRVAVLLPEKMLHSMQRGFKDFVEFFHINLKNISVDFLHDSDLSGFIKLLEEPKYTTVVKTLSVGINADDDLAEGVSSKAKYKDDNNNKNNNDSSSSSNTVNTVAKGSSGYHMASGKAEGAIRSPDHNTAGKKDVVNNAADIGRCNMVEQLSREYNKTVLLWPCPQMKASSNFLPSFEAISYAVQSIATKLNWTQVEIFVGDQNWGLPLAIASNLQIPYEIVIANGVRNRKRQDTYGRAIIVTADMNDASTLDLLRQLEQLRLTKVLLIDMVATSFSAQNRFYKNLEHIESQSQLLSNLLLLTVLSDNYRHFLNVGFKENGFEHVQNFRQLRRWRYMTSAENNRHRQTLQTTNPVSFVDDDDDAVPSSTLVEYGDCVYMQNTTLIDFVDICQSVEQIVANCTQATIAAATTSKSAKLRLLLQHICHLAANSNSTTTHNQQQIANLRNYIDFFNFYDFLVANILQASVTNRGTTFNKYDFIVLDVVRVDVESASSAYSATGTRINGSHNNGSHNNTSSAHQHPTFKWRPLLILEQHELKSNTYITHSILPGYDEWLLTSTAQLQCGAICWTIAAICVGLLFIIVAASVAAGIALRNYLLRKRLSKGPNKIVLSASDFVFPVDSRRVDEGIEAMLCCWLQQLQEFGGPEVDKPDLLKGSLGSLRNLGLIIPGNTTATTANGKTSAGSGSLARHNPALLDRRARYNGDLVQLKEIPLNGSMELKSKAMDMLVMAHGLRHENINPLLGWLSDANRTAMVFDYCSRGSLQDVLIMDDIKLDWSFRLSLLTDLVRGMRYLHTSPLRMHGALSSRNCVVDARWVLKITDYGLASFYEAQGLTQLPRSAKELLWTAPELLRSMKPHHQHHGRVLGTQMGDVYSFGIIMQEVVVRGEPYCMLSLTADEIIAKIKKPPPLIRPSVSKGAAPPEAINIMRQCWAELPDMRPDFNSVYERFKMLNHGRKVNFVDTMFQMLEKYSNNLEELIRERTDQLDIERKKTEKLLNRMLPRSVAEKLKMGLAVDPEEFSDVTIYFSDIVGFTTIAAHCSPVQVVDLLNDLYTIFDATINAYNVYKVETIGDAYMVVSGLPVKIPDHAEQIATMALDLLHQSGRFNVKHLPGVPLQLRIGLHTGPCCAGVVGLTMPRYCLFGDTVNTASRMESTGSSWRIHMSQETRDRLEARGGYTIEPRGLIDIKGKGMMNTFWLLGKKGFEKPLPTPPPIGLDELLIRNSITLKAQANKSRTSTNPSSSQSSSLAGESVEVKVEITPPTNADGCSSQLPNSYSLDSNSTNTISPNLTLCPDFPTKTPSASPQSRKFSELTPDSLLNPNSFNRLPNSAGGSSSRLYKKIEELMDLSSPYNHYKCLSPSESNLTQFSDGKYLYSVSCVGGNVSGGNTSGSVSIHGGSSRSDGKPGSSRLLRRQFSLDRDDSHTRPDVHHQQHHQSSLQASHTMALSTKSCMLDIPMMHDTARSPKISLARVVHKQNSTSIAQDLEKIEEIPLSPASSQHHSSLDSNLNRSPPSTTLEVQTPPTVQAIAAFKMKSSLTTPSPSAPASPYVLRSMNGIITDNVSVSPSPPPLALCGRDTTIDSSTTDISTTTTATVSANSSITNTIPAEDSTRTTNIRTTELTLNVETLMTR